MLSVSGTNISVAIEFPSLDFDILPRVVLLNRQEDLQGAVAHIEDGDRLCYAAPGSVVLDFYNPDAAVLTVLDLASQTLSEILTGSTLPHIQREFPQHWLGSKIYIAFPLDAPDGDATLFSIPRGPWKALTLLARGESILACFPEADRAAARRNSRPAHALRTRVLDLPPGTKPPTTFADFLDWASACEPGLERRVLRAAQKSYKEIPSIFVVAENGCVGIDLCLPIILIKSIQRAAGHARFMDTWRKKILVKRWSGALMTGEFMLNRNLGGEPSLADQAIVLVGCGTIGSHLAKFLAQSGAGFNRDFILIDPDIYTPGNVGRHLLGPGSIGLPKADACRDELKRLFPHGRFRSVSDSVLSRLDTLEGATLVIDATGEEAVSIALNEILVKKGQDAPTAIFTWLAGAGAAAQAFLMSSDAAGSACLKCLHPDLHDARQYWPLKSVDCTDEVPPACGEAAFAPYGVAAPAIAAGLAIKLCMDWAKGQPEPRLRTIRVDLDKTIPIEDCNPKASQSCPACG